MASNSTRRHRVCMVSDFFFPNMGGVEMHIWCLAQCLAQRRHKVVVVTHAYEGRQGVRRMTNGLKVYYLPLAVVYDQVVAPALGGFFALFRNILIRERIGIVHGHQSVSPLTHEALLYARTMGLHTCYTDHSLFGFADLPSIHVNRVLAATLSDNDHVICVSHACRENLVLRAHLHPSAISTIPNAVDCTRFLPNPSCRDATVNIVVLSRLVYRKGVDILAELIPQVCQRIPTVRFIVGGDGPKRLLLEEMRERHQLHDRVELLGAVPHHEVRNVLVRGHVFLNCSLTESFCIALLEAAACGLFVVSTKVGGVPEVLPPSMLKLAEPRCESLCDAVMEAVLISRKMNPREFHDRVKMMYSWLDVARRTERVYHNISALPRPSLATRLLRYSTVGAISGLMTCLLAVFLHLMLVCLSFICPQASIETCPDISLSTKRAHVYRSNEKK